MHVRVVLVRPRNPLNIGAAARAMANFGFSDLAVVEPYAPVWRETVSAVGAEKLVLAARAARTLEEAAGDCQLIVGATAVRNRRLERPVIRLPDFPEFLKKKKPARLALVFGPEKTGLSNKHLERCHAYLTVPTSAGTPSMNLSHSVAVCCYELARRDRSLGAAAQEAPLAEAGETEQLVRHVLEAFQTAGYLDFLPKSKRAEKIRRTLLQWSLHKTDIRLLHGILRFAIQKMKA
jgi:tRNA/rRNA methyltransferase